MVDFQFRVMALHVQWVRRFVSSSISWVPFMVFWFSSLLAAPPHLVFSALFCFFSCLSATVLSLFVDCLAGV